MLNNTKFKQTTLQAIFLILLVGVTSIGHAQLRINSPYSRYGIGDLSTNTGAYFSSMGGLKYSILSDSRINRANAASYVGVDSGSFLFDVGFRGLMINNVTTQTESGSNYFNLDYIKFAFPVTSWYRSSIGLMPYSMVGYDVRQNYQKDSIGQVNVSYLGDGGVNQVYWGNGFKINSELSVGFNAAYLFGGINARRMDSFPDINYAYNYKIVTTDYVKGFYFDLGVQYHKTFNRSNSIFKGKTLSFGVNFAPQQKVNFESTAIAYTYSGSSLYELVKDTLKDEKIGSGKITIPLTIGGGFSYGKKGKWLIGADATYTAWEDFRINDRSDSLTNSLKVNVGGEYYINDFAVRMGARYDQGNLNFRGEAISDLGISFGVGIPLRKYKKTRTSSISNLDLGIELGQRGTTNSGLIQQKYLKLYMSVGIQNTWFQQIKYQ